MSRQAGSIVSGDFKAAPDIRQSGPAAGGGYVLRVGLKVKARGTAGPSNPPERTATGLAGRSGRARTCAPRFWRPVLYQLSYTPVGSADPRRFKHRPHPDCKGEAVAGADHMGWLGLVQQPPAVKLAIANSQFFSDALLGRIVDRGLNRGSHNPLPGVGSGPQLGIGDGDSGRARIDKIGVGDHASAAPDQDALHRR